MYRELTPWQDSPRTPQEIIMRLAGRTTFVALIGGGARGGARVGPADISHALASRAADRLGAAIALGVALPDVAPWPDIHAQVCARMREQLAATYRYGALIAGARGYRLPLVVRDGLRAAVLWRQEPSAWSAHAAHMRRVDYVALYGYIDSAIHELAGDAARAACDFLFNARTARHNTAATDRRNGTAAGY